MVDNNQIACQLYYVFYSKLIRRSSLVISIFFGKKFQDRSKMLLNNNNNISPEYISNVEDRIQLESMCMQTDSFLLAFETHTTCFCAQNPT